MKLVRYIIICLTLFWLSISRPLSAQFKGEISPFENGKWMELDVSEGGFYRLTYSDIQKAGFDLNSLNPKTLRIHVSQGTGYPDVNGEVVSAMPEIPIFVSGENDNRFDANDYLIFYVQPLLRYESNNLRFRRNRHQYSNKIIAYIGSNNDSLGKRITTSTITNASATVVKHGCVLGLLESDLVNPLGMGRIWLGEKLGNETLKRNYSFAIPANADSTWIDFRIGASMVDETGSLDINYGTQAFNLFLRRNSSGDEPVYSQEFLLRTTETGTFPISLSLNRNNSQSGAFLDYAQFQSFIQHKNHQSLHWYYPQLNTTTLNEGVFFEFSGEVAERLVWDVSNPYQPQMLTASVASGNQRYFRNPNSEPVQLAVSRISECQIPKINGTVSVAAINKRISNSLYITTNSYLKTLQNVNWQNINPNRSIVTVEEIYKEYSGGQADLGAIRAYLRFLHNHYKDANGNPVLKYVTLVGAASYDFFDRLPNNSNHIPIYQSSGEQKTSQFSLDDYIGFLEKGEGDPRIGQSKLNVIIGRVPARNESEIVTFFNKREAYLDKKSIGSWRNRITFVTDDIDEAWEKEFIYETEDYAQYIATNHPYLRVNRIYGDAFLQKTNGNNEAYPEMTAEIKKTFQEGSLFINYQGHGGETGWGQEAFFDIPTINSLENPFKYPVLFTATCEFSRYDNPALQSAGEKTLFRNNGGAIALMTTTRTVWVSGNSIINDAFWKNYGFPKPNEPIPTLGDLYGRLKNRPRLNSEDNKFALLGDPSMKLAFPEHVVTIDTINELPFEEFKDTLKAFKVVNVKGHVNERLKGVMSNFNGYLDIQIFDKPVKQFTLDNDGVGVKIPFEVESSIIYKGRVSVVKGMYQFAFAIPKDINYQIGEGRCVLYASNGEVDAAGFWKFLIGGSETIQEVDTVGPQVKAFMGDTLFKDGGRVQTNTQFVATVFDKNGLNATGAGIGRDMILTIDKGTDSEKSYVVNEFFTYAPNSYQKGIIEFPLNDLSPGIHTAYIKVWDIYNNSGYAMVNFEVTPGREVIISESHCFPNPLNEVENLRFSLIHNVPNEDLTVKLKIFTISGSMVYDKEMFIWSAPSRLVIPEYGDEAFGGLFLPSGLYVYQIQIQTQDGLKAHTSGKILKP